MPPDDRRGLPGRRLFFAFDLDETCREAAARLADRLRADLTRAPDARAKVTWVERSNLHVTVRFLGATPETSVPALCAAVEPRFESPAFELRFDRLGVFPGRGAPRVIWIGSSVGREEAQRVCTELEARLRGWSVPPDSRPFHPHVTLGRFRGREDVEDRRRIGRCAVEPFDPLVIDHLTLYESHLSASAPSCVALRRVPLSRSR